MMIHYLLVVLVTIPYAGNCVKLYKTHTALVHDGHFFSDSIINVWNSLPDIFVSSATVTGFRLKLKSLNFSLD